MIYLASRYSAARLLPDGPAGLARIVEWTNWLSGNVHAMSYGQIWRPHRFIDNESLWDAIRDRGQRELLEQYAYIELLMSDGRGWALPAGYSIVDPYLLVFFLWGQRIGLEMRAAFPHWTQSTDRVLQRAAVRHTMAREGVEIL